MLVNVNIGRRVHGIAGTTLLDSITKNLAVDTEPRRALKLSYIRAAQWRLDLGSEDRWVAFAKTAIFWNEEKIKLGQPWPVGDGDEAPTAHGEGEHVLLGKEITIKKSAAGCKDGRADQVQNVSQRLRLAHGILVDTLSRRYATMATSHTVTNYLLLQTEHFENTLLRECGAVGTDLSEFASPDACVEWLLVLVDQKETDVRGLVAHAVVPCWLCAQRRVNERE